MWAEWKDRCVEAKTLHGYVARCLLARKQVSIWACFHILDSSDWSFKKMQCITRCNFRHRMPLRYTSIFQSQITAHEQIQIWWFAMFRLIETQGSLILAVTQHRQSVTWHNEGMEKWNTSAAYTKWPRWHFSRKFCVPYTFRKMFVNFRTVAIVDIQSREVHAHKGRRDANGITLARSLS